MGLGIQLYSVRDKSEVDFKKTLKDVADIGYKDFEFAGYYGIPPMELKAYLDEIGAKAINAHVPYDSLLNNFDEELAYAKALGMEVITVPYLDESLRNEKELPGVIANINKFIEKLEKENIKLAYHNHDFEFQKYNDKYMLDILLEETNIYLELDTFWVAFAGIDVFEYIEKVKSRLVFIHLKDMNKNIEKVKAKELDEPVFAELGNGSLDILKIYNASKDYVKNIIVEQDACKGDSLKAIETSYNYIKENIK